MFGYGFLAVVLVLYLAAIGLSGGEVGLLLGLTLLGDAARLAVADHARGPDRTAPRADRRGDPDAPRGVRVRRHPGVRGAPRRGHHRRRQPRAATRWARSSRSSRRRWPSSCPHGTGPACSPGTSSRLVRDGRRHAGGRRGVAAGDQRRREPGGRLPGRASSATRSPAARWRCCSPACRRRWRSRPATSPTRPSGIAWACIARGVVVLRLSALFALDAFAGGFAIQGFIAFWFNSALRRGPGDARRDPLGGQRPRRVLGPCRRSAGRPASG